jgi:hypothetical protein
MADKDDRTLEYINDMTKQLGKLSKSPDLAHLRYLLQMAEIEAAQTLCKRQAVQPERAKIKTG